MAVTEIDGPVVRLELQGACGSCPSSTMTMKMGLERRLKEVLRGGDFWFVPPTAAREPPPPQHLNPLNQV